MHNTTTFSAYWHVDDNTKLSADKHLQCVINKDLDFFFAESKHPSLKTIDLKFDDLPSHKFINNLSKIKTHYDDVYLKFTHPIKSSAFVRLATIWTSKILLFEKMLEHTDADYIMWTDCVHSTNKDIIYKTTSNKCAINKYSPDQLRGKIFGGMITNDLPSIKILAQVIKIPRHMVMNFIERYEECLRFVDNNYIIYDEEIVLTIMHDRYPQLFNLF